VGYDTCWASESVWRPCSSSAVRSAEEVAGSTAVYSSVFYTNEIPQSVNSDQVTSTE
jgi:hypothetical protein